MVPWELQWRFACTRLLYLEFLSHELARLTSVFERLIRHFQRNGQSGITYDYPIIFKPSQIITNFLETLIYSQAKPQQPNEIMISRKTDIMLYQKSLYIFFGALLAMKTGGVNFRDFNLIEKRFRRTKVSFCLENPFFSDLAHRVLFPFL